MSPMGRSMTGKMVSTLQLFEEVEESNTCKIRRKVDCKSFPKSNQAFAHVVSAASTSDEPGCW
jgi:hypothetical protein